MNLPNHFKNWPIIDDTIRKRNYDTTDQKIIMVTYTCCNYIIKTYENSTIRHCLKCFHSNTNIKGAGGKWKSMPEIYEFIS